MTIYPPKGKNTGAAMMVLPGGGYEVVAIDLEGTEVCDWVIAQGMTCILLKYRVPQSWHPRDPKHERAPKVQLALQDAQRAIGLVRQRAAVLHVDPHRIGVIGFSAGGHLAAAISNAEARTHKPLDEANRLPSRPDFAMILYSGHLWAEHGAPDSLAMSPWNVVRLTAPPTFLVQSVADPVDDVRHSVAYMLALRKLAVPVELHLYADGGHAFGLRRTSSPITNWAGLAVRWLHTIRIL